ncbi:unnamed protein product [Urochloa humidicola]
MQRAAQHLGRGWAGGVHGLAEERSSGGRSGEWPASFKRRQRSLPHDAAGRHPLPGGERRRRVEVRLLHTPRARRLALELGAQPTAARVPNSPSRARVRRSPASDDSGSSRRRRWRSRRGRRAATWSGLPPPASPLRPLPPTLLASGRHPRSLPPPPRSDDAVSALGLLDQAIALSP